MLEKERYAFRCEGGTLGTWNERVRVTWIYRNTSHDSPEAVCHSPRVPSRESLVFGIVVLFNIQLIEIEVECASVTFFSDGKVPPTSFIIFLAV